MDFEKVANETLCMVRNASRNSLTFLYFQKITYYFKFNFPYCSVALPQEQFHVSLISFWCKLAQFIYNDSAAVGKSLRIERKKCKKNQLNRGPNAKVSSTFCICLKVHIGGSIALQILHANNLLRVNLLQLKSSFLNCNVSMFFVL